MSSNQKLLVGVLLAPLIGALAFLLTASGETDLGEVLPEAPVEEDAPPMADLRTPDFLENEEAYAYLDDRWGHLGDSGAVTPHTDTAGELYFVEPKIYRARLNGKVHYMRAISHPQRLGKTVRASQALKQGAENTPLRPNAFSRADTMAKLAQMLPPIEDPNDMPPHLRDEHPLSPDYKGPLGSN